MKPRPPEWRTVRGAGKGALVAMVVGATVTACGSRGARFVSAEDPAYCPCSGAPACPVDGGGSTCVLVDVERADQAGPRIRRRCGAFDIVSIHAGYADYVVEASSGKVIASVEHREGYLRTPEGLAPNCRCRGPEDLRVGPLVSVKAGCGRAVVEPHERDGGIEGGAGSVPAQK
jgi:hypothetical protein